MYPYINTHVHTNTTPHTYIYTPTHQTYHYNNLTTSEEIDDIGIE